MPNIDFRVICTRAHTSMQKNEVWSDCGTACPQTCTTPPNTMCIDMCQSGCFCKSGYVRNKSGGTCILQSKC
ncbi:hypothetical protein BKA56DRAFT_573880 [Ilyonectria sp. MPI-CAGE-AT-0026]|nr:hypothetical protein BKA56DRAFT_573880 [Ilyonectria sp. MPI-CAGE-AT-0026]